MRNMTMRLLCVAVIAACLAAPALAANFFPITGITSSTAGDDLYPVENLILGPGVGFDAIEPHDKLIGGAQGNWVTAAPGGFPADYIEVAGMPILELDLGQDTDLTEISVWGYADTNSNGVSEFSLRFATAADGPGGFGTSITFNPNYFPAVDAIPRQSFPFGEKVTARYVEFTNVDNYYVAPGDGTGGPPGLPGGDRVGLGEIAFATDVLALSLEVNRDTGGITIRSPADPLQFLGYAITSAGGALDSGTWTTITGNYDASGDGSVDSDDDWTVLSAPDSRTELSEAVQAGGDGGVLADSNPVDLGTPWIKSPVEDARFEITLSDGTLASAPVTYVGNNDSPFAVADMNFDGVVDTTDWPIYRDGYRADLSALSQAEAYQMGDLNGDGSNNVTDYGIFKTEFDAANGAGAFDAMVASVPEPATWVLLAIGGLALGLRRFRPKLVLLVAVALCVALAPGLASAQVPTLVSNWTLDSDGSDAVGGHDGSPTDVTFGRPGANANTGTSASFNPFDGTSSTIEVPYSADLNPTSFTVTLWADANATGAGHQSPITSRDDVEGGVSTHGYVMYNAPSGNWEFWTGDGDPGWPISNGGAVTTHEWTHLAISFDAATNLKSFYVNGVLASSTVTQGYSPNGTVESENLHIGSGSDLGDNFYFVGTIDDVAVFNGALTGTEITNVMDNSVAAFEVLRLSLEVDTKTGKMTMLNELSQSVAIDQYEILSDGGSLSSTGWDSLEDQNLAGFPAGDGSGDGWEELGSPNSAFIGEAFLQGDSAVGDSTSINLGSAYNTGVDAQDLSFSYRMPDGSVVAGIVTYVESPFILGDVNRDDEVNGLDVDPFVDVLLNGPFQIEADMNLDGVVNGLDVDPFVAAVVGGGAQAVPEPSTLVLLSLAAVLGLAWRRR